MGKAFSPSVAEAERVVRAYYGKSAPTEEDDFMFTEAMDCLISVRHSPADMMALGGHYYERGDFDLALKYYDLAAEYKYEPAYECLGYIWYYGRTGQRDFEKAYRYFSLGKEAGNPVSAYKIADMYKNGYYVEKDEAEYRRVIEELYPRVKDMKNCFDPVPEVAMRLARIRTDEGKTDEAVGLYLRAREYLERRVMLNSFFGDLNNLKWCIDELYQLIPFDEENFGLSDLFLLLRSPCLVRFTDGKKKHTVRAVEEEDGSVSVCFDDTKWFRDRTEFFRNAVVRGEKLTAVAGRLYGFELVKEGAER